MRVVTIFTGGTIGSKKNREGVISTDKEPPYQLLAEYRMKYETDMVFDTREPYCILSENLMAENIELLIREVQAVIDEKQYDGVIITHGTDTLQYTAALLGYVFSNVNLPILLVSSNFVLDDVRANGAHNFAGAVKFIQEKCGTGVFVSYANPGEEVSFHRGSKMQYSLQMSDREYSVRDQWYGRLVEGRFEKNKDYKENISGSIFLPNKVRLKPDTREILRIIPYPGMNYSKIPDGVKVVLHESFHSGTIAISEGLRTFCREAQEKNVPIFLSGWNEREAEYETVDMYRKMGIVPLSGDSVIAQYCLLWLAISNGIDVWEVMKRAGWEGDSL